MADDDEMTVSTGLRSRARRLLAGPQPRASAVFWFGLSAVLLGWQAIWWWGRVPEKTGLGDWLLPLALAYACAVNLRWSYRSYRLLRTTS